MKYPGIGEAPYMLPTRRRMMLRNTVRSLRCHALRCVMAPGRVYKCNIVCDAYYEVVCYCYCNRLQ